jgi:hypothetical protein
MLLEELLSLPIGTRVFGDIDVSMTISGVVALLGDGSHFIRWEDGYSTIPLGRVREYDEYIASRTALRPTSCHRGEPKAEEHDEWAEASARDYTAGVTRT